MSDSPLLDEVRNSIGFLKALRLRAGDILLLKMKSLPSQEDATGVQNVLSQQLPEGVRMLMFGPELDVDIYRPKPNDIAILELDPSIPIDDQVKIREAVESALPEGTSLVVTPKGVKFLIPESGRG